LQGEKPRTEELFKNARYIFDSTTKLFHMGSYRGEGDPVRVYEGGLSSMDEKT
jgi:hypothetical protein